MRRILTVTAFALSASIAVAGAQQPLAIQEGQYTGNVRQIKDSRTYFVPTVTLHLSHHGSVRIRNEARGASASARADYGVEGIDRDLAQRLATQIQEDLVAKLRAAGFNVVTWADAGDHASLARRDRMEMDATMGLPSSKDVSGMLFYMVANPTDQQAIRTGRGWAPLIYKDVAAERSAVMLWPEIWFDYPQVMASRSTGRRSASASVAVEPGMNMRYFSIGVVNGRGAGGAITAVGPIEVSDNVGSVEQVSSTSTRIASNIGRRRGDYTLTINVDAFSANVLRAGAAVNDLIVAHAVRAHR